MWNIAYKIVKRNSSKEYQLEYPNISETILTRADPLSSRNTVLVSRYSLSVCSTSDGGVLIHQSTTETLNFLFFGLNTKTCLLPLKYYSIEL